MNLASEHLVRSYQRHLARPHDRVLRRHVPVDTEQQRRFAEAVERKREEAEARSRESHDETAHDGRVSEPEETARLRTGGAQDERSIRDKSSGHGKKTADKWNQ